MDGDEDEFGDLYTDVLRPLSSAPIPPLFSSPDLNISSDEDVPFGAPSHSNDAPPDHPKSCTPSKGESTTTARVLSDPVSDPAEIRVADAVKVRVLTEERMEIGDPDPVIPGISAGGFIPGIFDGTLENGGGATRSGGRDGGGDDEDDWDSDDSEDDIQIVLNDARGMIGAELNEDEDEDGEDLVIVADDGDQHLAGIEEKDWGEEAAAAPAGAPMLDGEKKEVGETVKGSGGGMTLAGAGGARIGYSNHGYHSHHSQFKVSFLMTMLDSWRCMLFPLEPGM